jgi:hypothetical protein
VGGLCGWSQETCSIAARLLHEVVSSVPAGSNITTSQKARALYTPVFFLKKNIYSIDFLFETICVFFSRTTQESCVTFHLRKRYTLEGWKEAPLNTSPKG